MHLHVELIEAKSDVPLYLYHDGKYKVVTTAWQVLWRAPYAPISNTFAAFDVSADPSVALGFRVTCKFSHDLVGRDLQLQGILNGVPAISSPVKISGTKPVAISSFVFCNQFEGPVAYRGMFQWRLVHGHKTVATFDTETFLEFYSLFHRPSPMWPPRGLSISLLRKYSAILRKIILSWRLLEFYRDTVEKVFHSPFQYDNISGRPIYASSALGGDFKLNQYLSDLEAGRNARINCYDMAGIVQVILRSYPDAASALWSFLEPCGYINATTLKGWSHLGPCNNPFFGNTGIYNPNPLAPVNVTAGLKDRSGFGNHAFIAAPTLQGTEVILDATSGPHIGDEALQIYLTNAIDHVTDYYAVRSGRPGTAADINPNRDGITSISSLSSSSVPFRTIAKGVGSHPPNPVDEAMERSKVKDADPPRFSQINPTDLKSLLEHASMLKLTLEEVDAGANGSEALWLFGHRPDGVEVTLFAADSHETAVQRMRNALTCISAPLDKLFISTLRLGQRTLEAVGGHGFILFVRGNVFTKLTGMASSKELGKVAVEFDRFLKEREGDSKSVPAPHIKHPELPSRRLDLGEQIEVVIEVTDAGWMSVSAHSAVLQLIDVDEARAAFKFHAGGEGATDVRFVFAHKTTLQTATATMHVEVIERGESVQKGLSEFTI